MGIEFFSDDVFTKALADYTGELRARSRFRSPTRTTPRTRADPGAATTHRFTFELTPPARRPRPSPEARPADHHDRRCADPRQRSRRAGARSGSSARSRSTTAGPTATPTPAGNTVFATQGLFVPSQPRPRTLRAVPELPEVETIRRQLAPACGRPHDRATRRCSTRCGARPRAPATSSATCAGRRIERAAPPRQVPDRRPRRRPLTWSCTCA